MDLEMDDVAVHAAITDTILSYAEHVDAGDAEQWAQLFCVDAVFDEGRASKGEQTSRLCCLICSSFSQQQHIM